LIERNQLEINMALFSSKAQSPRVPLHNGRDSPDIAFAAWASIILIGLAILSVVTGIAPVADPAIFIPTEPLP
jgi:hypothetical protein